KNNSNYFAILINDRTATVSTIYGSIHHNDWFIFTFYIYIIKYFSLIGYTGEIYWISYKVNILFWSKFKIIRQIKCRYSHILFNLNYCKIDIGICFCHFTNKQSIISKYNVYFIKSFYYMLIC